MKRLVSSSGDEGGNSCVEEGRRTGYRGALWALETGSVGLSFGPVGMLVGVFIVFAFCPLAGVAVVSALSPSTDVIVLAACFGAGDGLLLYAKAVPASRS